MHPPPKISMPPSDGRAHWQAEQLYFDHHRYLAALRQALREARQSIDVEMYIFEDDSLGRPLLDVLAEAVARGLRVRVLVDGIGSPGWISGPFNTLGEIGIQTRIYHPAPWPLSRFLPADIILPNRLIGLLGRVNKRDHRKLFIIDRRLAFSGSMNITARHAGWRDTGIHVRGRDVLDLEASFELIWCRGYNPALPRERHPRVRRTVTEMDSPLVVTNHTLRLRRRNYRALLSRMARASDRVWITNPYFVPSPQLLRVLCRAAQRGADVRLLLPARSDVPLVHWVSRLYYLTLLSAGVRLYEYLPSVLHAKSLIVDDWARVGTSNLNYRSRYHDLEVDLVVSKAASIEALSVQFQRDLQRSQHITETLVRHTPWLQRLGGRLALLIRNWL